MAKAKSKVTKSATPAPHGEAEEKPVIRGPSPNPVTNLIFADIALRGGGRLLRRSIERSLVGAQIPSKKAHEIVAARGMAQTLLGTMVARIATRSVPGALIVGGALLAKTLYDRRKNPALVRAEGAAEIEEIARKGRKA
jgi:hypothetical protein